MPETNFGAQGDGLSLDLTDPDGHVLELKGPAERAAGPTTTIKCHGITCRQGFVEVANIHDRHINLEVWNVHPDRDLSGLSLNDEQITDREFTGNTEIELSPARAKALVQALQQAIRHAQTDEA